MTRNQGTLLVSGVIAAFTLLKEVKLQKAKYHSVMTFNGLFDDFMSWYEAHGKHLGINEFHREFKKHFEFVSVARKAIK